MSCALTLSGDDQVGDTVSVTVLRGKELKRVTLGVQLGAQVKSFA